MCHMLQKFALCRMTQKFLWVSTWIFDQYFCEYLPNQCTFVNNVQCSVLWWCTNTWYKKRIQNIFPIQLPRNKEKVIDSVVHVIATTCICYLLHFHNIHCIVLIICWVKWIRGCTMRKSCDAKTMRNTVLLLWKIAN